MKCRAERQCHLMQQLSRNKYLIFESWKVFDFPVIMQLCMSVQILNEMKYTIFQQPNICFFVNKFNLPNIIYQYILTINRIIIIDSFALNFSFEFSK